MAKSKVRKKKSVKKPVSKDDDSSVAIGVILIAAAVAFGLLVYGVITYANAPDEFKVGQCYLDRSYQPVEVTIVNEFFEDMTLQPMKIYDMDSRVYVRGGWFLSGDYSQNSRVRDFEFVREYYTKIPCSQLVKKGG